MQSALVDRRLRLDLLCVNATVVLSKVMLLSVATFSRSVWNIFLILVDWVI